MAFTVRPTADDELAIELAKKYVKSNKKGEILIECARLVPVQEQKIKSLECEVYRLEEHERKLQRIKKFFIELVS